MSDLSIGGVQLPEPSRGDRATQVGSTQHFTGGIRMCFFQARSGSITADRCADRSSCGTGF